ncbi:MAG: DNA-protecting protein DprA [Firmicutes bacterium]|nr:DNA-protecting protein DprA [Bacillota bacterium]
MLARMYLWGLSLLPHLGSVTIRKLVQAMGSEAEAFHATREELQAYTGIGHTRVDAIVRARMELDLVSEWEKLYRHNNVKLITWLDRDYPVRLQHIYDPPPVLYYRGDLSCLQHPTIAIVGRRRASPRGIGWSKRLGRDLAAAGVTVVSGLALGIDTAAHEGSLETGRTAAVLGTGLDITYPKCNSKLARQIERSGVLISPFPPATPPLRGNFPARNRIISGLSMGVIVVEAGERSGALITATMAVEQNRDVYAIPGDPANQGAAGPNKLIQAGAHLIRGAQDVLDEMQLSSQLQLPLIPSESAKSHADFTGLAHELLECLGQPLDVDELVMITGLSVSEVNSTLLQLVLAGMVEELATGVFQRVS